MCITTVRMGHRPPRFTMWPITNLTRAVWGFMAAHAGRVPWQTRGSCGRGSGERRGGHTLTRLTSALLRFTIFASTSYLLVKMARRFLRSRSPSFSTAGSRLERLERSGSLACAWTGMRLLVPPLGVPPKFMDAASIAELFRGEANRMPIAGGRPDGGSGPRLAILYYEAQESCLHKRRGMAATVLGNS